MLALTSTHQVRRAVSPLVVLWLKAASVRESLMKIRDTGAVEMHSRAEQAI